MGGTMDSGFDSRPASTHPRLLGTEAGGAGFMKRFWQGPFTSLRGRMELGLLGL